MKANPAEMAMLLDIYGEMLTEKQREFFEYYHSHDLSLSEIAENTGITRQGARDTITRAEDILRDMEEKLGLVERFSQVQTDMKAISKAVSEIMEINSRRSTNEDIQSRAAYIKKLAEEHEF